MHVRSIDPRTGQLVREMPSAEQGDVHEALARARTAQKEWAARPKEARISVLREAERIFTSEREDMVSLIQSEGGFPRRDIIGAYNSALRGVEYYAERYRTLTTIEFPLDDVAWSDTRADIEFLPHGVIAHIGIWNYPFWQTMITAIPALMVGNAIVFKPSEHTTLTGMRIAELLHQAGVPKDIFIPLAGGREIGREMVRADFDATVFTGGVQTGLDILHNSNVKPLVLELSGNDPGIVCADADIDQAARGIAYGSLFHAGQVCIRVKRVYVVSSVADRFLEQLMGIVRRIDVRERIGPLISEGSREKVQRQVDEAIAQGAELLHGGKAIEGPGYYFEPTVLLVRQGREVDLDHEIFGPVCPIIIVRDDEEALRRANDSIYGLGATIWSQNGIKAREMASQLEAGTIWINECCRTITCGEYLQGWKSSGLASAQDRLSMFLRKRTVVHHHSSAPRDHWFK
jgi:acyl-CoA reductase-like NAD-dependent aldehyde dehydrogenase